MTKDQLTKQRETVQKADHLLKRKQYLNDEKLQLLEIKFKLENDLPVASYSDGFVLTLKRHSERDINIPVDTATAINVISLHVDSIEKEIEEIEVEFKSL